jgi:hypothetical protein
MFLGIYIIFTSSPPTLIDFRRLVAVLKDYKYVIDSFGSVPGDQKTMNQ